jgi:hypothetical protein
MIGFAVLLYIFGTNIYPRRRCHQYSIHIKHKHKRNAKELGVRVVAGVADNFHKPLIVGRYDAAVERGFASAAAPAYLKNKVGDNVRAVAKDSLYRILQLYAATTHHQAIPEEVAVTPSGPVITTQFAPSTSSLPTTLLLSAVDPANHTQDPMDFSLAWHLYTVLRIVPALSSVVDLPVPHRLHTSYPSAWYFVVVIILIL